MTPVEPDYARSGLTITPLQPMSSEAPIPSTAVHDHERRVRLGKQPDDPLPNSVRYLERLVRSLPRVTPSSARQR